MARQKKETIESIERDIRKNYATCYWSEDSRTNSGEVPKEVVVEPAKLLERFEKAKRYVWMVIANGTSHGEYEGNSASASLFATEKEAIEYVKSEIVEMVLHTELQGCDYDDERLDEAVRDHSEWFGDHEAQFRDLGSIADWRIEKVPVPEPAKMRRRR